MADAVAALAMSSRRMLDEGLSSGWTRNGANG